MSLTASEELKTIREEITNLKKEIKALQQAANEIITTSVENDEDIYINLMDEIYYFNGSREIKQELRKLEIIRYLHDRLIAELRNLACEPSKSEYDAQTKVDYLISIFSGSINLLRND
jgi:hypothetical protein